MPLPFANRRENRKPLVMEMLDDSAVSALWPGIDDLVLRAFPEMISDPNTNRDRCVPAGNR